MRRVIIRVLITMNSIIMILCQLIQINLRRVCKHKVWKTVNYSYRPGSISETNACVDCGEIIRLDKDLVSLS